MVLAALHDDPDWNAALDRRGVVDRSLVQIDPWPAGTFGLGHEEGRRITRCLAYFRDSKEDNGYARPLEGLIAFVDMGRGEVLEVVGHGGGAVALRARELLPRAQRAAAHGSQAVGDHPARGSELRSGRQPRALAEVVAAHRHGSPGGPGAVDGRVRGRWAGPAHRLPGLGQRNGRALRAPGPHARLEERVRRRRMGPGSHGELADPRLRLPRRNPLLRRRLRRRARQAAHAGQRHLHARRGLRHPLEARRHGLGAQRGSAVASPGRELHRHGRQLRVRLLLVLLPRRLHAARGEADGDHVHHGRGRRRSRETTPA